MWRGERDHQEAAHAAEQQQPEAHAIGADGVREPRVAVVDPPDQRQHHDDLPERGAVMALGQDVGQLRDREDEDEVEEELERRDARAARRDRGGHGEIIPVRMSRQRIPARRAVAVRVERGQRVEVVNTFGQQVVDTWAFVVETNRGAAAPRTPRFEWMSMEHSRLHMGRLNPAVGDTLVTNQRRPILTLVEDTSGGVHDTLIAACDNPRYALLGCTEYHDNCADNLTAALAELWLTKPATPRHLNLFMNIPWTVEGALSWEEPVS